MGDDDVPDHLHAQIDAAHDEVARAVHREDLLTQRANAVEADPFRRVLPDHHKLRDVKTCEHCGFMHGWFLKHRDANPGDNMGFRSHLEVCCGLGEDGCPGRFHGNRVVRKTAWTKIETIQAVDECEKLFDQIERLLASEVAAQAAVEAAGLDADRQAFLARARETVRSAIGHRDEALANLERAREQKASVIAFNNAHRQAYDVVIAAARADPARPMDNFTSRQRIYKEAEIVAHNAVYDAPLYSGYVGGPDVDVDDQVVFTASVWRDRVWDLRRYISDKLQEVGHMLKRWKGENKYRFSPATTRLVPRVVAADAPALPPAPPAEEVGMVRRTRQRLE